MGKNFEQPNFRFALLGLGDSNYSAFCQGPKLVYQDLIKKGAVPVIEPGWADNGVGLEVVVEPWIEKLWESISRHEKQSSFQISTAVAPLRPEQGTTSRNRRQMTDVDGIRGTMAANLRHLKIQKWRERLGGKTLQTNSLSALALPEDSALTVPSASTPFLKLDIASPPPDTWKTDQDGCPSPHFKVNKSL